MFPLENQVANFLQSRLGDSMCLDFGSPGETDEEMYFAQGNCKRSMKRPRRAGEHAQHLPQNVEGFSPYTCTLKFNHIIL